MVGQRIEEIAAFYASYATALERSVARQVRDVGVAEEACSQAWELLLERPDVTLDERGYKWLQTTAVHAGWRQGRKAAAIDSLDFELADGETMGDALLGRDAEAPARVEAVERLELVDQLKPDQRRALLVQASGCSYAEVAEILAWSETKVNHELAEGRARLRVLEESTSATTPSLSEQLEAARAARAALIVQRADAPATEREELERRLSNVRGAVQALSVEMVEAQVRDPPAWAQAVFGQRPQPARLAGLYDQGVREAARFRVAHGVRGSEARLGVIPMQREARAAYREAEQAVNTVKRALGQRVPQPQPRTAGSGQRAAAPGRGVPADRRRESLGR
ncbi:MAG: hypothetical protein H0U51_05270 [Propionibacteriales bacterium]|nr:hypothetical protein [Propionibacteriales bacterium]